MIKMSLAGEILASILENDSDCILFLHNTRDEDTAKQIMNAGFRFEEQLTYSTDRINPLDTVEINYFLVERKEYGKYTVIIEIDKNLFRKYNSMAENEKLHFEELLSVTPPVLSDNEEYIYTLANSYVKGYLDITSGKFYSNKDFNPSWEAPVYHENYERLKKKD
ncbi:MAG: hypothetical protein KFF49_01720 [Bacteroidales bacterium]|nr:hypothetical protein [Bacteroidales bacterium]